MKQTLKIGDKVKVIKKDDHYYKDIGVIVGKSKCWDWKVEFDEVYQGDNVGFYYESELQLIKSKTKKVKKYKYTRKELAKRLYDSVNADVGADIKDLLAQKEDKKEHAYFTSPIFHEKTITIPLPLEIEELGIETLVEPFDKFVSQDRINHSFMTKINEIIRNQKKLYQLIKEKL